MSNNNKSPFDKIKNGSDQVFKTHKSSIRKLNEDSEPNFIQTRKLDICFKKKIVNNSNLFNTRL